MPAALTINIRIANGKVDPNGKRSTLQSVRR
jgi:hypothetical protein